MNTIKAQLAGLEDGSVAVSSADPDGLRACVVGPPLREGDADWYDAVVVWNGMVAKVPAPEPIAEGGLTLTPVSGRL
jgi:hypothetical protein